jgi:hypothetical protein
MLVTVSSRNQVALATSMAVSMAVEFDEILLSLLSFKTMLAPGRQLQKLGSRTDSTGQGMRLEQGSFWLSEMVAGAELAS